MKKARCCRVRLLTLSSPNPGGFNSASARSQVLQLGCHDGERKRIEVEAYITYLKPSSSMDGSEGETSREESGGVETAGRVANLCHNPTKQPG